MSQFSKKVSEKVLYLFRKSKRQTRNHTILLLTFVLLRPTCSFFLITLKIFLFLFSFKCSFLSHWNKSHVTLNITSCHPTWHSGSDTILQRKIYITPSRDLFSLWTISSYCPSSSSVQNLLELQLFPIPICTTQTVQPC